MDFSDFYADFNLRGLKTETIFFNLNLRFLPNSASRNNAGIKHEPAVFFKW